MKYLSFFIMFVLMALGSSQLLNAADQKVHSIFTERDTNNIKELRSLGYREMLKGNYDSSLYYYTRIVLIDSNDYDAGLATARLYYKMSDYKSAIQLYNKLLKKDKADVEALIGMGRCNYRKSEYDVSVAYFLKAIHYLPAYAPTYFDLARTYIAKDKLDSAIITYKKILLIDNTYAEAWEGIGKMLYWQGYPRSALEYYNKAVKLDPSNKATVKAMANIENELKFVIKGSIHLINESEDTYDIDAIIQKYSFSKRTGDHFYFSINPMLDYSNRNYTDQTEEKRWFDNTWINTTYLHPHHKVSLFLGASFSDDQLTSYGVSWTVNFKISKVKIKNTIVGAYDYFYYWNEVGQDYISNTLNISYKRLIIDGTYRYAIVRNNYIWGYEEKDINPNSLLNLGIKYQILKKQKIYVGVSHQYRNYEYQSPLYYTPYERSLYGLYFSSYYSYKKFYSYIEGFYGTDNYDVINWTASFELGFSFDKISCSIGGARFYNQYYKNYNVFFALKSSL